MTSSGKGTASTAARNACQWRGIQRRALSVSCPTLVAYAWRPKKASSNWKSGIAVPLGAGTSGSKGV
jgi:hypothetical protein